MRAYHFLPERWGLAALRNRRIKLARIAELNDPFELLAVQQTSREDEQLYEQLKAEMTELISLACFSRGWSNPVQWGQYADKHAGLCLGFDVLDEWAKPVTYVPRRFPFDPESYSPKDPTDTHGYKLLTTKFRHWQYEDEVRLVIRLEHAEMDGAFYFLPFCPALILREVIIGVRSTLTPDDVQGKLRVADRGVTITQARLASRSFKVLKRRG